MLKILLVLLFYKILLASTLEVVPSMHKVEYVNQKYLRYMNLTFLRRSRTSPYYISLELDSYVGVGNNLTLKMALLEEISSGHYQPTPIQGDYKLCDFLYKEPFFGQMYAKQLPGNWSCPFPAGEYHFMNLVIHLENFPFHIPFTWASLIVKTRADIQGVITGTNEEVFRWKTYVTVTQKMKKKEAKPKKNGSNSG